MWTLPQIHRKHTFSSLLFILCLFYLPNSQVPSWLYKSALHQPCESGDFIGFTSEEPPSVTERVASWGSQLPNPCGWKNSRNFIAWDKNPGTEEKGKSSFRKATLPSKQDSEHVLCVRWAVETPGNEDLLTPSLMTVFVFISKSFFFT